MNYYYLACHAIKHRVPIGSRAMRMHSIGLHGSPLFSPFISFLSLRIVDKDRNAIPQLTCMSDARSAS